MVPLARSAGVCRSDCDIHAPIAVASAPSRKIRTLAAAARWLVVPAAARWLIVAATARWLVVADTAARRLRGRNMRRLALARHAGLSDRHHILRALALATAIEPCRRLADRPLHALLAVLNGTRRADAFTLDEDLRGQASWLLHAFPALLHGAGRTDALTAKENVRRLAGRRLHAFPALLHGARRADALAANENVRRFAGR